MTKCYYVDSENIGDEWINLLENSDENSRFLIFYTEKSPRMCYANAIRLLKAKQKPEFILCSEGHNALDFQLVTYLGFHLSREPETEIIIVSKDTGFDAVVHFWTERNMSVSRLTKTSDCVKETTSTPPVLSETDTITFLDKNTCQEDIFGVSKDEIDDIIAACQKKNSAYIHNFLTHFYGTATGLKIYKLITSNKYSPNERNWDSKKRFQVLCEYIRKYSATDIVLPADFINFLYKHRKTPSTLSKLILNHYGTKNGTEYKKIFKPFFKTLAKL